MLWWAKELFTSLRFLFVRGDKTFWQSKRIYEVVLPSVVSAIIVLAYLIVPQAFSIHFLMNLSGSIFQFMVFVVPFHLAALGAFATFTSPGIDEELRGTNAQLRVWSNADNDHFYQTLTLRQYASLLFGYLCSIGIVFIVVYVIVSNLNFTFIAGDLYWTAHIAALLIVIFFVSHYAFLSIYAITFLFEKVNRIRS